MGDAEDHMELAQEGLELAKALAGQGSMSDREFLESMARMDALVDHSDAMEETGTCGHCGMQIIMAQAARDLLAEGEILDGMSKWSDLSTQRWREAKYFQFFQEEKEAGRDPHASFKKRGWEM